MDPASPERFRSRETMVDVPQVSLRFGLGVFQADWIVLKGPLSIVTGVPRSSDDQETHSLRSILSLRSENRFSSSLHALRMMALSAGLSE